MIAKIGPGLDDPDAGIIDVVGLYVMPGGVDVHTHLNLEVNGVKVTDGFFVGTAAAAFGGTTCVVEHPGFGPPEGLITTISGEVKNRYSCRKVEVPIPRTYIEWSLPLPGESADINDIQLVKHGKKSMIYLTAMGMASQRQICIPGATE
jgi:dihydropyrimidinase